MKAMFRRQAPGAVWMVARIRLAFDQNTTDRSSRVKSGRSEPWRWAASMNCLAFSSDSSQAAFSCGASGYLREMTSFSAGSEAWSSQICSRSYIGKTRLEKAISSSPQPDSVDLTIHSFELDQALSREPKSVLRIAVEKSGVSLAEAEHMEDRVAAAAQREGLPFTSHRVYANTFDAHRMLHLAAAYGVASQLLSVLQRELFSGRADIYDHAFLAGAASELGVPRARAEEVLAGNEYADAVRRDEDEARRLGVTGVPFVLIDGRLSVPGAASTGDYAKAIDQAQNDE
jgi:predicted DsbA family dithiol-disulfide isomerase